jgi:hypothetical protein
MTWRLTIEVDERPDDSSPNARPEPVRVKSLTPDVNFNNAADGYMRAVRRYAEQQEKSNYRRVVWNANYGLIRFESDAGKLVVIHELYYEVGSDADAFTVHRVPLVTPSTSTHHNFEVTHG